MAGQRLLADLPENVHYPVSCHPNQTETPMKPAIKLVEPCNENRQVMPVRPANADLRSREYLTPAEIERLLKAAKDGRWGHRDATLIMVAYRHGLRELPARSANQTRRIKHGATSRSGRARRLEGARRQRCFSFAGQVTGNRPPSFGPRGDHARTRSRAGRSGRLAAARG